MASELERRVRRLERTNLALGLVIAVGMVAGAAQVAKVPKEIRAESLVIVDEDGNQRITMGSLKDMADLQFWSKKESADLSLGIDRDSSYVVMTKGEKMPLTSLTVGKAGGSLDITGRKESVRFGFDDRETFGVIKDRDGNELLNARSKRPVR